MKLENDVDEQMVCSAVRYCLGRRSYVTSVCTEWLKTVWPQIGERFREIIRSDIQEAIHRKAAGDYIDEKFWKSFLEWEDTQILPNKGLGEREPLTE